MDVIDLRSVGLSPAAAGGPNGHDYKRGGSIPKGSTSNVESCCHLSIGRDPWYECTPQSINAPSSPFPPVSSSADSFIRLSFPPSRKRGSLAPPFLGNGVDKSLSPHV